MFNKHFLLKEHTSWQPQCTVVTVVKVLTTVCCLQASQLSRYCRQRLTSDYCLYGALCLYSIIFNCLPCGSILCLAFFQGQ